MDKTANNRQEGSLVKDGKLGTARWKQMIIRSTQRQ